MKQIASLFFVFFVLSNSAFAQTPQLPSAPEKDYCPFAQDFARYYKALKMGDYYPFKDLKDCKPTTLNPKISEGLYVHSNFGHDVLEARVISEYVGSGYTYLNYVVRFEEPEKKFKMIEIMDRALAKIPNYEGVVYEGNSKYKYDQFKVGQRIHFRGYLSTSTGTETPMAFSGIGEGVIFKINVKTGKDLSSTYNTYEKEVLMPRGTTYVVRGWEPTTITAFGSTKTINLVLLDQVIEEPPVAKSKKKKKKKSSKED